MSSQLTLKSSPSEDEGKPSSPASSPQGSVAAETKSPSRPPADAAGPMDERSTSSTKVKDEEAEEVEGPLEQRAEEIEETKSVDRTNDVNVAGESKELSAMFAIEPVSTDPVVAATNAKQPQKGNDDENDDAAKDTKVKPAQAPSSAEPSTASTTTVPLPRVTKSTRRETFAKIGTESAKRKVESHHPSTTRDSLSPPHVQSSGSSGDEDMMDLFSPPKPSSARSRLKPMLESSEHGLRTPSQNVVESEHELQQPENYPQLSVAVEGGDIERKATDERPDSLEDQSQHPSKPAELEPELPARLPVSRHHITTSNDPHSEGHVREELMHLHDNAREYPIAFSSIAEDINFESNDEIENALQISFESSGSSEQSRGAIDREDKRQEPSPLRMQPFRSSPIVAPSHAKPPKSSGPVRKYQPYDERKVSTSKESRTPSRERYPPPPLPQPPPQPGPTNYPYPVYYSHPHGYAYGHGHPPPPVVASPHGPGPAYPSHPSSRNTPQMPPTHMTPGYPPPPGYSPWGSQPPHASHPGYYVYPSHPSAPHYHYPMPPPDSGSRTPGRKRDRKEDVDATMETADLTFEEEVTGPNTPPSTKKAKDSYASAAWSSPHRGYEGDTMDTDATPHKGSAIPFRSRREHSSRTPSGAFDDSLSFGAVATPARDILPSGSWSPMGLFDDDEIMAGEGESQERVLMEGTSFGRSALSDIGNEAVRPHYQGATPPREREAPRPTMSPPPSLTHQTSPTRGGMVIKGSPIARKTEYSANRGVSQSEHADFTPIRGTCEKGSEVKLTDRYQTPSGGGGSFRIKIGSVGMETAEARKGMEGINSVLRGSPVSAQRHGSLSMHPPSTPSSQYPSSYRYEVPSSSRQAPTPIHRFKISTQQFQTPASARKGIGKENTENDRNKSSPCNCKKSKCLKLYCECFSAEKYCQDCKCSNCQNTPVFEAIRQKAITDTKAKNPQAFKPRIASKPTVPGTSYSPATSHATGCKCKKSACLKKYCECFEAGIVCSNICKCSDCQNFIGSQALIDRRRKIKDLKGAETAMKSSDEAWRGSMSDSKVGMYHQSAPTSFQQSPIIHVPRSTSRFPSMMMMSPLPTFASPQMRPPYPPFHGMMGQSPMMYPHTMGHPHPPYSASRLDVPRTGYTESVHRTDVQIYSKEAFASPPSTHTMRHGFPHSSQKSSSEKMEAKEAYFGANVPKQTKSTALSVFSYLSNDDLFNASIVSKAWSSLAFDDQLWTGMGESNL